MIYDRPGIRIVIRIILLSIEIFIFSFLILQANYLFAAIFLAIAIYQCFDLYHFIKKIRN